MPARSPRVPRAPVALSVVATAAERPRLYMVTVGPARPSRSLGPHALAPPSASSSRLSHAVALAAGTHHDRSSQQPSRSAYRTAATSSHPRIAPARTPTSHCEVGAMSSLVKTDITCLPLRMAPARRDSQNCTWMTTPKPHSCSAHSRSLARSPSSKTMFVYPRMCLSTPPPLHPIQCHLRPFLSMDSLAIVSFSMSRRRPKVRTSTPSSSTPVYPRLPPPLHVRAFAPFARVVVAVRVRGRCTPSPSIRALSRTRSVHIS
jgi:hypothetical protein